MKLTLDYLKGRHSFWKEEIGKAGIWNPQKFKKVKFEIRDSHRGYNAVFQRKLVISEKRRRFLDKIIIYNKDLDFDPNFLDSVLVHEMIHQYIFQNDILDSSTHGQIFKDFKNKINHFFEGILKVNIRDSNPSIQNIGSGKEVHNLLLISQKNIWYCCLIHPSKVKEFNEKAKSLKQLGKIRDFGWVQSNDLSFCRQRRCVKQLKGRKLPYKEMIEYLKNIKARKVDSQPK